MWYAYLELSLDKKGFSNNEEKMSMEMFNNFELKIENVLNKKTKSSEVVLIWKYNGKVACTNPDCHGILMRYRCRVKRNCRVSNETMDGLAFIKEYEDEFPITEHDYHVLINHIEVYKCPLCNVTYRILPPLMLPNKRYCIQDICATINKGRRCSGSYKNVQDPFMIAHAGLILRWMLAVLIVSQNEIKNYQHNQKADYTYLEGLLAYILIDCSKQKKMRKKIACVRNELFSMKKRDILQSINEQGGSLWKLECIFRSMQMTIFELMPSLK